MRIILSLTLAISSSYVFESSGKLKKKKYLSLSPNQELNQNFLAWHQGYFFVCLFNEIENCNTLGRVKNILAFFN